TIRPRARWAKPSTCSTRSTSSSASTPRACTCCSRWTRTRRRASPGASRSLGRGSRARAASSTPRSATGRTSSRRRGTASTCGAASSGPSAGPERGPDRPQWHPPMLRVLVVDDEKNIRATLALALEAIGCTVGLAANAEAALALVAREVYDLALVDLKLAESSGLDLIPRLVAASPGLEIVVITAYATIDTAVEAMRRGA